MNQLPYISQTMLDTLLEQVCMPISFLARRINPTIPLWEEPIKWCQQIEKDEFAVNTIIQEAKKYNGTFSSNVYIYNAVLCRVYIILYYRHRDDEIYQKGVFPSLKKNMGFYVQNDRLNIIHNNIDKILELEKLKKKTQEEKKKDVKPLFKYVMHSGIEADHLCLEYNEERLFRNMIGSIKEMTEIYDTRQDVADVWYNSKEVVHTLKNIKRPELIIERIATALVAGQMYNGYKGSQIVLICVYAMVRSSKENEHFIPFIKEMESLTENPSSDLEVIKSHINQINNWLTENQPFDNYDYIGEEKTDNVTYTDADIKRIRQQIIEQESREREKLEKENENLKIQLKEKEVLENKLKEMEYALKEEKELAEEINWHDKVRLELVLRLIKKDGANLEKHGNKTTATYIMNMITDIPKNTCKNYCTNEDLNVAFHSDEILKLNSKMQALGMEIRL